MLYVHGGGMDQPLGLIRMDYSYDFPDPTLIVPHPSWRGTYETASFAGVACDTVWVPYNELVYQDASGKKTAPASLTDENGFERDTTQTRCVEVDFPGKYQGMTRLLRRQTASGPIAWMGSLMQDAQDASGLLFRRNRYYDPASGRFTQEDPIGLAGGLNSYGLADGDPVNYSDPYGLCDPYPQCIGEEWKAIGRAVLDALSLNRETFRQVREITRNGIQRGGASPSAVFMPGAALARAAPTARNAARNFRAFADGQIERPDILVDATTVGRTLQVHEVAFYPGREVSRVEMRDAFRSLQNEARERGYEKIELTFHRTKNENGHVVTRTIDLTK